MKRARAVWLVAAAFVACTGSQAPVSGTPGAAAAASAATRVVTSASGAPTPSDGGGVASDAAAASAAGPIPAAPPPAPDPRVVIRGGGARAVAGRSGVVTSVEAQATQAGVAVLEAGGNAVDAAVAVAYALAVTHPSAGNIGGGGFILVRPKGGPTTAIDFRETAPRALTDERFRALVEQKGIGAGSVGVPGSVAGLDLAEARFGRLGLSKVLTPAIRLARRGTRLGERQASTLRWAWKHIAHDALLARVWGARGKPKKAGSLVRQPELAVVLERIAQHGDDGFYRGATAEALVAQLRAAGGYMTTDDLGAYHAVVREPLVFHYRGYQVQVMPPPSGGGVVVAQTLGMLERLAAWEKPAGSADELHLFLEAARRAQAERRFALVDPDALAADELARRLARWSDPAYLASREPHIDPAHATPSQQVSPLYSAAAAAEHEHTTHLSVVDADGMVVSLTTTLSAGFGAQLSAAGFVLNDSVAAFGTVGENLPVGGRRTVSSMTPTLVLRGDQVVLVLGSPGGDTIPCTVVQVLRNVLDHGMTIDAAVDAPRVHHGFVPDEFRYERARPISPAALAELERRGQHVSKKRIPMGDANDVLIDGDVAYAYADPREGGLALAARAAKR